MNQRENISASRRRLLKNGLKISALSIVLIPFKKAFASGTAIINRSMEKVKNFLPIDKLVLNTKTGVVHLPSGRIFAKYPTIKRQMIISQANWETQIKPYRLVKEKSGIIIEMLTLTILSAGINDKSLTDAYRILSVAFINTYKSKTGELFNKYNFRLHHLLLYSIALNSTIPVAQKWGKFQLATDNIDYTKSEKPIPGFMSWLKSKMEFDKKVSYILQNKSVYTTRLVKRASPYK